MRISATAVTGPRKQLVIGLVNNMPDPAVQSTEKQFLNLLQAGGSYDVRLKKFYLPEIHRSAAIKDYFDAGYADIAELWDSRLDGLIVTGTEPRHSSLPLEPYWYNLTRLAEWAESLAISTIWSCLAAHAAVEYMTGVRRRPIGRKLSGVFECTRVEHHDLLIGMPQQWRIPHSRHNEVPEDALIAAGYRVLTRSEQTGADIFVSTRPTLQIFLQGHPEYGAGALGREYRRDVKRFLSGTLEHYPDLPHGYFAPAIADALHAFREKAIRTRSIELLSEFPGAAVENGETAAWHQGAIRLYRNWLAYLSAGCSGSAKARSEENAELALGVF